MLTLLRMRQAIEYRQRRARTIPPPLPSTIACYGRSPQVHPDDGRPLGRACRPAERSSEPLFGDRWAAEIARARAEGRAPRGRRRSAVASSHRPPLLEDVHRLRDLLRRRIDEQSKPAAPEAGAALTIGLALTLARVLTRHCGRRLDYLECDAERLPDLRMPASLWRCWARAGWRWRWSQQRRRSMSRLLAKHGLPSLRCVGVWRQLWERAPWSEPLLSGPAWSARTGEPIPTWLEPVAIA